MQGQNLCTYFTGSPLYLRLAALLAVLPYLVLGEQCVYEEGVPQDWAGDASDDYYYDVQGLQRDRYHSETAKPESAAAQFKECQYGCCWQGPDICCPMPSGSNVAVIIAACVSLVVIVTITIIAIVVGIRGRKQRNEKQHQQPRQGHIQRSKYHHHPPTRALIVNEKSQQCGKMFHLPVEPPAYVLSPPKYEEISEREKQLAIGNHAAKGTAIPCTR